ncbi:RING-H2 finger protein ATL20-like [Euphorbia lathyris]|uniref:RING-H2 finger protein ATL20-like n=1 Tax=Euphorbia lathyris TaxID=212925 RepID=UPI003313E0C4
MALLITSLFIFLSFLNKSAATLDLCTQTSCSRTNQQIRFPFGLNSADRRCSYPGFGLSCNNKNQTILTLPHAGTFIVRHIYYEAQKIHIKDPGNCLARRLLGNFSLSESPFFFGGFDRSFVFLNCSTKNMSTIPPLPYPRLVGCMSNENDTVVALPAEYEEYARVFSGCGVLASGVEVPVSWSNVAEGDTTLFWSEPDCFGCEQAGGTCGYNDGSGYDIGCHDKPRRGLLPRGAKYGLIIGAGIPGLLCIIGLGCYLCGRLKAYNRSRGSSTGISTTFPHPPSMSAIGLDGPTIELYPKTLLGESRRLPKPNDNTCPICLSEYQPKETLRTIPECNHYFHAECIDEWLKMKATCPLCRNSPDVSSIATPSSSLSSSSLVTPSSSLSSSSLVTPSSSLSASSSSLFSGR